VQEQEQGAKPGLGLEATRGYLSVQLVPGVLEQPSKHGPMRRQLQICQLNSSVPGVVGHGKRFGELAHQQTHHQGCPAKQAHSDSVLPKVFPDHLMSIRIRLLHN